MIKKRFIKCFGCSKVLSGRVRRCGKCRKPLCMTCSIKGFCVECQVLKSDEVITDYYNDKYEVLA